MLWLVWLRSSPGKVVKLTVLMTINVEQEKIGGGTFLLIAKLNSRQFMTVSRSDVCVCTLAGMLLLNLSRKDTILGLLFLPRINEMIYC